MHREIKPHVGIVYRKQHHITVCWFEWTRVCDKKVCAIWKTTLLKTAPLFLRFGIKAV